MTQQQRAVFADMTPEQWVPYHEQQMRQLYEQNMADVEYRRLLSDQNLSYRLSGLPSPLPGDDRVFGEIQFHFQKLRIQNGADALHRLSEQDRRETTLRIHCAMCTVGCVGYSRYGDGWLFLHCGTVAQATLHQIATLPHLPDDWEAAAQITPPDGAGATP